MQGVCYFGIFPEVIGCIPGTRSACRIGQVVQNWKQNGNQLRTRWGRWIRFLGKGTVTTVTSTCDRKRESVNNLIFKYIMIQIGWLVCFVKTLSTYYTYTYKRTPKIMKSRLWTLNLTIAGYFWTIQLARLQTWTRLVFFSFSWNNVATVDSYIRSFRMQWITTHGDNVHLDMMHEAWSFGHATGTVWVPRDKPLCPLRNLRLGHI